MSPKEEFYMSEAAATDDVELILEVDHKYTKQLSIGEIGISRRSRKVNSYIKQVEKSKKAYHEGREK